jgi:hypothetical protein
MVSVETNVLGVTANTRHNVHVSSVSDIKDHAHQWHSISAHRHIEPSVNIHVTGFYDDVYTHYIPGYSVNVLYDEYDEAISSKSKFIGWEYYLGYTAEEQSQIKSIY